MSQNRISGKLYNSKKIRKINRFFVCDETKPKTQIWRDVLEQFAYDIVPSYINGKLGIISYTPNSYALTKIGGKNIVVGYSFTMTNPDCILLMDKLHAFFGPDTFNLSVRKIVHIYTDPETIQDGWAYVLSDHTLSHFESIESVKDNGFWDFSDEDLFNYMDRLKNL